MKDVVDDFPSLLTPSKAKVCPFRTTVEDSRSKLLKASEGETALKRFFSLGRDDLVGLLSDSEFECLPAFDKLGVVSGLAIHHFAEYVRAADKGLEFPFPSLDSRLLEWEQLVLNLEAQDPLNLLINEYDGLSEQASIPDVDIESALAGTAYTRPSSILLQAGLGTLRDYLSANCNEDFQTLLRFINAETSTHILDPRFNTVEALKAQRLAQRFSFAVRRFKIFIAVKTSGVIDPKIRITRHGKRESIYKLSQRPRMKCAIKLTPEMKYFVERETGGLDF